MQDYHRRYEPRGKNASVKLIALTKEWVQEQTKHLMTPWVTTDFFTKESQLLQRLSNHVMKISNQKSFHDLISILIGCLGGTDYTLLERKSHIEQEQHRMLEIENTMIKPYLYKWTRLKAKLNSLTCLNFITRIPNTVDTDTDVGTA